MTPTSSFSIRYERIGALPIVQQIIEKLGIEEVFQKHVRQDSRDKLPAFKALSIALCNVIIERYPLYKMGQWAVQHGLVSEQKTDSFNDDRVGRMLDRLFAADRAAIIGEIIIKAITAFKIDTSRIHNDSTSISFFGNYEEYEDTKAAKPARSKNSKDHRPDLKQVVFSLSVAGDGAVPLYFKVWDGNTTDDITHKSNWMTLRSIVGHSTFIYVADCKLCVKDTMQFIATEGGFFITVMPQTRQEIKRFQQWIQTNNPQWKQSLSLPNTHDKDGPPRLFLTYDSHFASAEGFRIIWVKSSAKQFEDEQSRMQRIEKTQDALTELSVKAHRNYDRLTKAVTMVLQHYNTEEYFDYQIVKDKEEIYKQIKRGRPTADTSFRKIEKTYYRITFCQKVDQIQYDSRYDGIFPLISNCIDSAVEILKIYKYQPYLEKRHEQLKSVYDVAPVYLQNPQRIEALLLLYFLGLLVTALMERKARQEMKNRDLESIPIYPEGRKCKSPTADKLLALFSDVRLQYICRGSEIVQVVPDELSKVQQLVLDLLGLNNSTYFK